MFKALEHRPDGVFLAPGERGDMPALILEAQKAADADFFLRLYAESGRFLLHEKSIRRWQVLVICPSCALLRESGAGVEFLERRVRWLELRPDLNDAKAPPLLRTLALLLETEERLPRTTAEIHSAVAGTALEGQIADATAAIQLALLNTRPIPEICAMGGITLEDFTQSVAYREIFGLGEEKGRQQGLQAGELEITLRLLRCRCGDPTPEQQTIIRALPRPQLEALAGGAVRLSGSRGSQPLACGGLSPGRSMHTQASPTPQRPPELRRRPQT